MKVINLSSQSEEITVTGGEIQYQILKDAFCEAGYEILNFNPKSFFYTIRFLLTQKSKSSSKLIVLYDYSKRFNYILTVLICKYIIRTEIIINIGAFYLDYRTSKIKNFVDKLVTSIVVHSSDLVLTTGDSINSRLMNMGIRKKNIHSIYPALRKSFLSAVENSKEESKVIELDNYFLTVGRFHPVKGYEYLITAIRDANVQNYKFVIVGDVERNIDYYNKIMDLIDEFNVSDKIVVYGPTTGDEELVHLYKNMYGYIHTSVWESSPITVIEASLFEKPILASNVGGTSEYVSPSNLVNAKNSTELTTKINELIKNPSKFLNKNSIVEDTKERTWDNVKNEYCKIIEMFRESR